MSTAPAKQAHPGSADISALREGRSSGQRPPPPSALSACLTFGWRGILKIKHVPEQLIDVVLTPVALVLLFTYLFGGAIAGSTREYLQYILPGIVAMGVLFTTVYSGLLVSTDMTKGVVDRFRSLPVWRPAPLVGALLGDSVRYLAAAVVTVALGLALGYRPAGGLPGLAGAVLLVVVFAFGLAWVFTTLGLLMRAQTALMNTGFTVVFLITVMSNIFVDPATMPSAVGSVVEANPISHLVTAARALTEGAAATRELAVALATAAGLTAVFAPLTAYLYRSRA